MVKKKKTLTKIWIDYKIKCISTENLRSIGCQTKYRIMLKAFRFLNYENL